MNGTTFRRRQRQRSYTQIDNGFLLNPDLSLKAKGLLAVMMSRPEVWTFHMTWLEKQSREGREALRSGMQELINAGYVARTPKRGDDGKLAGWEYEFDDAILKESNQVETDRRETRQAVKPLDGKPATTNKDSTNKDLRNKGETEPPPPKAKRQKGQTHDFDPETVDLPDNFDRERFVDFCAMRSQKKDPLSALALKNFIRMNQSYSVPVLNRMFDNAIVPGWKALYPLRPWEQEEAERTPVVKSEADRPPVGSKVDHPNWGVNTVRFYLDDGYMVLDECGARALPNEVTPVPADTPIGYASCLN